MKRLKTYKLFESESRTYDISLIEDMLFDYSDKDISVNINRDSWTIGKDNVEYLKIDIRNSGRFKIEECLFDAIDYLEGCGLVLMDDSWMWNDMW